MEHRFDVIIIGGGAAGMFLAAHLPSALKVAILESNDRVGKKLLATGNGKCNLTNLDMDASHYNRPEAVKGFLDRFGARDAVAAFEELGLVTKVIEGRVYPYSECASTVLDVLRRALAKRGTQAFTSHSVTEVEPRNDGFAVRGKKRRPDNSCEEFCYTAGAVALATGSAATFGKDSTELFVRLGHTSRPMTPSLAPIRTDKEPLKGLQGVRVKAGLRMGDRYEAGEVLFKEFGVSGIAAFNMSSELARGRAKAGDALAVDFMPDYSKSQTEEILLRRAHENTTVGELLLGIFHSRVQERIMWAAGCASQDLAVDKFGAIANAVKNYKLTVEGVSDASLAQVMSGGLDLSEFDDRLMSLKVENAYALGEALDIDGDCGGYNLQWAWSSAVAAARAIAEKAR